MEQITRSAPYIGTRNGRYYAFWYDPASRRTRRVSLGTTALAKAELNFAAWLASKGSRLQPVGPLRATVETALEAYLSEHVAKRCADPGRQEAAAAHLIAFMGSKPLAAVDIPLSRAYTEARRAGRIGGGKRRAYKVGSDSTIRRELVVLVAAANHARRWKRITESEMPSIELPQAEADADDGEGLPGAPFFSREQIAQLIAIAGEETSDPLREMQRYIRLCYYSAARRRSIENLTVRQVSIDRRKINLATPGKLATKKRQPVVPIFDAILEDVQVLTAGKGPMDRLLKPRNFYRDFMALCRALDFDEPHHPHMLRHSRATHLLQDGKAPYDVAALLGDTMKTVEANYGHHTPDDLRGALE